LETQETPRSQCAIRAIEENTINKGFEVGHAITLELVQSAGTLQKKIDKAKSVAWRAGIQDQLARGVGSIVKVAVIEIEPNPFNGSPWS